MEGAQEYRVQHSWWIPSTNENQNFHFTMDNQYFLLCWVLFLAKKNLRWSGRDGVRGQGSIFFPGKVAVWGDVASFKHAIVGLSLFLLHNDEVYFRSAEKVWRNYDSPTEYKQRERECVLRSLERILKDKQWKCLVHTIAGHCNILIMCLLVCSIWNLGTCASGPRLCMHGMSRGHTDSLEWGECVA